MLWGLFVTAQLLCVLFLEKELDLWYKEIDVLFSYNQNNGHILG